MGKSLDEIRLVLLPSTVVLFVLVFPVFLCILSINFFGSSAASLLKSVKLFFLHALVETFFFVTALVIIFIAVA